MDHMPIEWLMEVPPVTRVWSVSIVVLSGLEYVGLLNKLDFYYSIDTVFNKHQYHRLVTSFLYFGELSMDLLLTLFFVVRHSRSVEERFRRKRDFVWFLLIICSMIILYSSFVSNLYLLGSYLNDVLLFLWSRQNSGVQVSFLGFIRLQAIYLPFFYLGIGSILKSEGKIEVFNRYIVGIVVGHVYNYLNESFPKLHRGLNPVQPIWYWFSDQQQQLVDNDEFVGIRLD